MNNAYELTYPYATTRTTHEHVVVDKGGLIIQKCGIPHSEPFPWQECPVAKNWTLIRGR